MEAPSTSVKRRPRWLDHTLRDVQEHVEDSRSTFRQRKPLRQFPSYMALVNNIIDSKPTGVEEATCH